MTSCYFGDSSKIMTVKLECFLLSAALHNLRINYSGFYRSLLIKNQNKTKFSERLQNRLELFFAERKKKL